MVIKVEDISEEGYHLQGEESSAPYEFPTEFMKNWGPVRYDLTAFKTEGDALITGSVEVDYEAECARTLKFFPQTAKLSEYAASISLKDIQAIDLTPLIREDILLSLPMVFRSEEDTDAEGSTPGLTSDSEFKKLSQDDTWAALDDLDKE